MLNLFKNYAFKTSILDDFQFYEDRQKAMQEKRARQQPQQILTSRGSESDQRHTEDTSCESQEMKFNNEEHGNKGSKILNSPCSQAVACNGALCDDGGKLNLRQIERRESSAAGGTLSENVKASSENRDTTTGITNDPSETTNKK